jgi:hypothetical protein
MAIGQRGSWFAAVDGELLPCVHTKHMRQGAYSDPAFDAQDLKWTGFVDAIRGGRVILTRGETHAETGTEDRKGYVAVFRVEDIATDDGSLRFRLADRLIELE